MARHLLVFAWTADWRHALEYEHYRFGRFYGP